MTKKKTIAKFSKDKALVFEADMTNVNEVEFSKQLKKASKGTKSLGEMIENLVAIQRLEQDKKQ